MITSKARFEAARIRRKPGSVAIVAVLSKGSVKQTSESVEDIYGVQIV
jgi:hypothetical protein